MCDDGSVSTDSEVACGPAPGALSSSAVAKKGARVSAPETHQGFVPLRSRSHFDRVFATGERRRCGGVTVISVRTDGPVTRVGLVVSRRVGTAVDRNRAKRRLREGLRAIELEPGRDHVVIATRAVVNAGWRTLVAWLEQATGASTGETGESVGDGRDG